MQTTTKSTKSKTSNHLIEKPGTFQGEFRKEGGRYEGERFVGPVFEKRSVTSYARSGDGRLHASASQRGIHAVTDARSGLLINTFGSKKEATGFIKSVTRRDGSVSPTMNRAIAAASGEDRSRRGDRAKRALEKIIMKHDSLRRQLQKPSNPSDIKRKSSI